MYAVIKTGGKQYRVSPGDKLKVEKLEVKAGGEVVFDQVLMVGGGDSSRVGTPVLDGVVVKATVEGHGLGDKIVVYTFKRRKGFHKKRGHRQDYTLVRIGEVVG